MHSKKFKTTLSSLLIYAFIFSSFLFLQQLTVKANEVNLISNPSLELGSNEPNNWNKNNWGTNTAQFEYLNNGQEGSRSVKVTLSSHTDGDAKWYFNPVSVAPNTQYTFSDHYKSNVTTYYVAWAIDANGNNSYFDIGQAAPNNNWTESTFNFTTPANAESLTVFHIINTVGWLQTDNTSLVEVIQSTPTPTPTVTPTVTPSPTITITPSPNPSNPIVNSDVESGASSPTAWNQNAWGLNDASFQYVTNDGQSGSKSLKVTMNSYTDGDAKWYFNPITVQPNKQYIFSNYQKSNVETYYVARFTDQNGNFSYVDIGTASPSISWKKEEFTLTTASNTQQLSVFHIINRVGYLQTDSFTLSEYQYNPTIAIPNASFENANGNTPASWQTNSWGTLTASFEYLNTGHSGDRSVKTIVTNYTDGDAKWYHAPVTLTPGEEYQVSNYYQSNTTTYVIMRFDNIDGTTSYVSLPPADPSTSWKQYSATFAMPLNAQSAAIYHVVKSVGYLIVDDFALTTYAPIGFNRALLTLSFDDGWEDNHDTVLPLFNEFGMKSTQFYATTFIEGTGEDQKILDFYNAGHEIGSHSVTHPDLTTLTPQQLTYEITHSKQYLEGIVGVGNIKNFATPYGAYNNAVIDALDDLYGSHRSVDTGYNSKDNFRPYQMKVQNILSTTTAEEVESWVEKAQADKTWLILVYHRIGANPGPYDSTPALLREHLEVIDNSEIPVVTMQQGLTEVLSQL